jgi:peptidoglycan DL-endopeptidase CwlO
MPLKQVSPSTPGPTPRPGRHRRRPALAARFAVVASSAAATAAFAITPGAPAPAAPDVAPAPAATAPVTAAVVPVAATTRTMDLATAAVPAAQRASAMRTALGKVGAPYRWGATGPGAFDCSGLVTYAFKSAGKSLPRSARAMSRVGTPVAKGALQPGDLVFFYRSSHVGIYVGNGKVVHASNPRHPVGIADVGSMPFAGARRL